MTDDMEPSGQQIISAVRQVLEELAPQADPQDVEEFIDTLREGDPDELEVNIGAGFGQFFEGKAACDAAFARYAELIGTGEVKHNPS
jgi:hypothetical protein